ncbi:MAG: quinone-dependent dihydroorotate dehydrogenase [Burkholderiales bacterium]|nr:quinone-dependent dihydroorotate dehydrogenase [Burkholderiales bacterium]
MSLYGAIQPLLFRLDGETAHDAALRALHCAHALHLTRRAAPLPGRAVRVMGIDFPNPVGLAAGLDKNGAHIDALASFGFGFIEIGTVTPRPQPGNPRPRMFRLPAAQAVINRMGFNNQGVDALVANVSRSRFRGVLGINIGKNFDTPIERAADDYVACLRKVYPLAGYIAANVSSPNTKNLRELQQGDALDRLLGSLMDGRESLASAHGRRVPIVVKLAPDLEEPAIEAAADAFLRHRIDGVIATNTTIARDGVAGLPHGDEAGGLSGAPVKAKSTQVLARLHAHLGDRVPLIGVGGILGAIDAKDKMAAGASLVQVYTGLVYRGPRLVKELVAALR